MIDLDENRRRRIESSRQRAQKVYPTLSDEQLDQLAEELVTLAEIILDTIEYQEKKRPGEVEADDLESLWFDSR